MGRKVLLDDPRQSTTSQVGTFLRLHSAGEVSVQYPIAFIVALCAMVTASSVIGAPVAAQYPGTVTDAAIAPGANFDKAALRLWVPDGVAKVRAILLLVPGSNGDGRPQVADTVWQHFAVQHQLALIGVQLTDKPHDQNFNEEYIDVRRGSGDAVLRAVDSLCRLSHHPELSGAPLLLWGMSAGGEFNYEFVAWKPERVIAFVVNKGGIYYTALASHAARNVPGIFFVGGKDLEFRTSTIAGIFAVNRRSGALWAYASEPDAAHVVGRSRDVAMVFFEDMLTARLASTAPDARGITALASINDKTGFIGDVHTGAFSAAATSPAPVAPTAWLPTERTARAWRSMILNQPFEQ
jgi:poly(3-hydroxybutyrate) depolymerase